MMFNKKGQGLSVNAIVLIVLGVIILVMLIAGFTLGWSNIIPFLGGEGNIDNLAQACSIACAQGSVFDYCDVTRVANDGTNELPVTCSNITEVFDFSQAVANEFACASITCLSEDEETDEAESE